MSGEKHSRLPSNEEVIDELTKDVQNIQVGVENSEESKSESHIPEDFVASDNESNKEDFSDSSDEEELKVQDKNLMEEEKEAKRAEAIALKKKGNDEFKSRKYLESIKTYTEALRCCPLKYNSDRAVLYANRAASKMSVERKASAIDDCTKAISLDDVYLRAYARRARLYEETDKLDKSLEDYKKIVELDPRNTEALSAIHRLPPLIHEQNEKLKAEMLGKLKELGNMVLRPFGLSTNNFQVKQDLSSGGYSINFQQNPTNGV